MNFNVYDVIDNLMNVTRLIICFLVVFYLYIFTVLLFEEIQDLDKAFDYVAGDPDIKKLKLYNLDAKSIYF